ncbi:hypothetical protein [Dyadobacter frigoris]|uniref:Uncharacterized protein n=1 Tax=Dyadobacter frigoris TaxID=2576211 RepID=A0A4V6BJL9_9BACT|nr:hypothetical protein [Dyadobacter frigoris]TKT93973.1 hypothetical protein FDK13_01815 [Dyadobacter frigoris]GLU50808.1 hypothetical protein Dfri01_02690 [Dyadobacter frigoris]
MVNELSQIDHLFKELIALLSAESQVDPYNVQFLKYVEERRSLVKQTDGNQAKEAIRGINRYSDEFAFSDAHAKKIKDIIDSLYDLVNC